jgi:hypothetical protein
MEPVTRDVLHSFLRCLGERFPGAGSFYPSQRHQSHTSDPCTLCPAQVLTVSAPSDIMQL